MLNLQAPLLIEPKRLTVAALLKREGYRTAAIGKWHLGFGAAQPVDYTIALRPGPLDLGFAYFFGVPSNHGDNSGVYVDNEFVMGLRSRKLAPFGKSYYGKPFMGLDAPQRVDEDVMPQLADKAVAWLEQQKAGKPFFL